MNRIHTLCIIFLFLSQGLRAQKEEKNISILLIPYPPEFYLSDAERDIMQQSDRNPDDYRIYFRKSLDLKLQGVLEDLGTCVSMLQDTTIRGRKLLEQFYEKTAYSYSDPIGNRSQNILQSPGNNKLKSGIFGARKTAAANPGHGEMQFMQAEVKDTAFLTYLASLSQTKLFISINQFEFKTNYNSCIDISSSIHQRELIVHYSVFNKEGKQLLGNYIVAVFSSNESRDRDIAERLFPTIASKIKAEINTLESPAP